MPPPVERILEKAARDIRGSVAVVASLTIVIFLLGGGMAIDYGRLLYTQRITASAIDAAVLAGARTLQMNPSDHAAAVAAARRYYESNVTQRMVLDSDTVAFSVGDGGQSLAASGTAYLKTTLLAAVGIERMAVVDDALAGLPKAMIGSGGGGASNIEVAVMLDVTGSMCPDGVGPCTTGTKITGLKDAAKGLVDLVVQADQSKLTSRVALVPFSTRIRVAPNNSDGTVMKKLTNLDPTWTGWYETCTKDNGGLDASETGGNWQCLEYTPVQATNWKIYPCVADRFYEATDSVDTTDVAPGANAWLLAHGGDRFPFFTDSSDTVVGKNKGLSSADPSVGWNYGPDAWCADAPESNVVVPLTSDKSALKAQIAGLEAYGSTSGALGTAWAWYMLSPNWNGIFPSGSPAGSYNDVTSKGPTGAPLLRKVAVLMTDGGYNTLRAWKDQDQHYASDGAAKLCSAMKAKGIEVYTVAFALNELPVAEQALARKTLQDCGSDVSHFYETLTVDDLKAAFRDIAVQLTAVYLKR